jgi:gliding-associated putative ABC transporter substrate-binding component GldG
MKKNITIITISILLALAIVSFLANRHFVRLDLTKNRDYTLAPATQKTLKDLKDVVTLRIYFTQEMPPQLLTLKRLIDDTVSEFRSYGGQNVRVEYVDPASDEAATREAVVSGVTPVQLNVQGQDKLEVAKVYLGMVLLHGDKKETIPVIAYPQNLEYDMVSRIVKLTSQSLPKIAWWAPPAEQMAHQPGQGFQLFRKEIEQRYAVVDVKPDTPVLDPAQQSTLILISPRNFNATQSKAIDTFLANGGQVVALMDTMIVTTQMQAAPQVSGIDDVLTRYGISLNNDLVMDRANANAVFSGGLVSYQIPYPFWVKLLPRDLDKDSRIVSGLDNIVLPWTSSLTVAKPAPEGVTTRVLATTSEFAQVQNFSDGYYLDPETAGSAMQQVSGGKILDVIALAELPKGGKLFVVGTSRLLQDQFLKQFPQDAALVANAVDIMAFGDQLVGIRTRGQLAYPIEEMTSVEEQIVKYANMVGGVILVLALAIWVFSVRRSRRKTVQLTYQH